MCQSKNVVLVTVGHTDTFLNLSRTRNGTRTLTHRKNKNLGRWVALNLKKGMPNGTLRCLQDAKLLASSPLVYTLGHYWRTGLSISYSEVTCHVTASHLVLEGPKSLLWRHPPLLDTTGTSRSKINRDSKISQVKAKREESGAKFCLHLPPASLAEW